MHITLGNLRDHWVGIVFLIAAISFVALALVPTDRSVLDASGDYQVVILPWWIHQVVGWSAAVCFFALLVVAVDSSSSAAARFLAVTLALVGLPLALVFSVFANLAPWTIEAESVGPDGRRYLFMDSSFLQGQTLALAYEKSDGIFGRHIQVLGNTNGDSPRSWASVVRPSGAPENDYGQLYWSSSGELIGIRYAHKCYMLYSTRTGQFTGRDDVENISPFILIDAHTQMSRRDINAVTVHLQEYSRPVSGVPREAALRAALDHPNPDVRKVASRWLKRTAAAK